MTYDLLILLIKNYIFIQTYYKIDKHIKRFGSVINYYARYKNLIVFVQNNIETR